jgi:hypothetical protein
VKENCILGDEWPEEFEGLNKSFIRGSPKINSARFFFIEVQLEQQTIPSEVSTVNVGFPLECSKLVLPLLFARLEFKV